MSDLYPGSISDKQLTRQCSILDLLECGDSVMADRGFDIEEDLALLGVRLNIPPFRKGKEQFNEHELVETRCIASLRMHVEQAMEQVNYFHIFDRPYHHRSEIPEIKYFLFVLYLRIFIHLCADKNYSCMAVFPSIILLSLSLLLKAILIVTLMNCSCSDS